MTTIVLVTALGAASLLPPSALLAMESRDGQEAEAARPPGRLTLLSPDQQPSIPADARALLPATPSDLMQAQGRCECPDVLDPGYETGVFWRGDRALSLPEIVSLLAPVLWFSTDEPMITQNLYPFPRTHPCDQQADHPVVYYQVNRLSLRSGEQVTLPEQDDLRFWDKVESVAIRYYFYYPQDFGVGGHQHDLEVAEFTAYLEQGSDGCYELRLSKVVGFAHGVDWYYNELRIQRDTWYPITLLVEEGKHATSPDRNSDGVFTPGYDVNVRIKDAWGIRDVFASSTLGSGTYEAFMTKQRDLRARMFPVDDPLRCTASFTTPLTRGEQMAEDRYELRPANLVSSCPLLVEEQNQNLAGYMADHQFGADHQPRQNPLFGVDLDLPLTYSGWFPPLGLRFDGNRIGIGMSFAALEMGGQGYFVGRLNWVEDAVSIEGMITPTAAQFFSWYASAGAAYERRRYDLDELAIAQQTQDPVLPDREWQFVAELGVKYRFQVSGVGRIFTLGYQFGGVRFGVRNSGFDDFSSTRLIVELGAGLW